jgi:glycosyltransferase involved in cell wall biosynthesis
VRVIILGNYPYHVFAKLLGCDPDPKFGVSTWLVNLANHLASFDNIDLHILAEAYDIQNDFSFKQKRITYHFIRPPERFKRTSFFETNRRRLHKEILRIKPDVLHAHHTDQYAWCAVNEPIPAVVTVHGVYRQVARSLSEGMFSHDHFLSIVERLCLKKAKYLISISPYVMECVSNYFNGVIFKIENPIQEVYFQCQDKNEKDVILFCAVLSPRKGLSKLVEVVGKIKHRRPGVSLHIIGRYPPDLGWYKNQIDDLIIKYGLSKNIHYLGLKDGQGICEELSTANCLVMTSIEETAPMVISEAMAAGKPVVAMDVGGIRYMIQDGATGYLVSPGDTQDMADKVVKILEDGALRKTMGEAARKEALQRFHPDIVARKTRAVYEEILQRS